VTHSHGRHDSSTCAMSHPHVRHDSSICAMSSRATSYVCHGSIICTMTHTNVRFDSCIRAMTHSHVRHASCIRAKTLYKYIYATHREMMEPITATKTDSRVRDFFFPHTTALVKRKETAKYDKATMSKLEKYGFEVHGCFMCAKMIIYTHEITLSSMQHNTKRNGCVR